MGMPFATRCRMERALTGCLHCGTRIPEGLRSAFCCTGCQVVYDLLRVEGLDRYYALAGGDVKPVPEAPERSARAWLEPLLQRAQAKPGEVLSLELDVQGIHCAACVWLIEELFRRAPGGVLVGVNPALGKLLLRWRRDAFDVRAFLSEVERFGYRFGPSRKRADPRVSELTLRLGICAALTMNVMILSVSFYFGLAPSDGEVFRLFSRLSAALSFAVVLVGGWPFFRSAIEGLRRRVLHLDLPIAAGIVLVFATSLLQARGGRGDLAYFDTLNTFVTLMLLGRWLQQRVLERNRRALLEDDGAEGLFVRRVEKEGRAVGAVPVASVRTGDVLLVAPGDLVPVQAELQDDGAELSTAWITGESRRARHARGEVIAAGACNESSRAIRVCAREDFGESELLRLLRAPPAGGSPSQGRFWDLFSRRWVAGVAAVTALGILIWWPEGPDRALEVAAALLVVTCPCAIGIAVPLAYELVQARLRRQGVFIRSPDLLDRLPLVRKVVFDKTGTLTLGRMELTAPEAVFALSPEARNAAYDMTSRSSHPVSRALHEALSRAAARFDQGADVVERAGAGLELVRGGVSWRLGSPSFTLERQIAPRDPVVILSRDLTEIARFELHEALRPDARRELSLLEQDGYVTWLVSGDAQDRVIHAARELHIPAERALFRQSPDDKARAVERIDRRDTLFLGDGVNDSLAFSRALCAGTPATDRPLMPSRADFFLLGEGIRGVRLALQLAQTLRVVVRRLLAVSLAYNVVVVAVCLAGLMTPLRAAIVMPATSLSIVLFTVASLSGARFAAARRVRAAEPADAVIAARGEVRA